MCWRFQGSRKNVSAKIGNKTIKNLLQNTPAKRNLRNPYISIENHVISGQIIVLRKLQSECILSFPGKISVFRDPSNASEQNTMCESTESTVRVVLIFGIAIVFATEVATYNDPPVQTTNRKSC